MVGWCREKLLIVDLIMVVFLLKLIVFLSLCIHFQDGIISVEDIDLVMTEGLGMRYAFIGPIETMHLNAPKGMSKVLHFKYAIACVAG